jgi:hypothetical protein
MIATLTSGAAAGRLRITHRPTRFQAWELGLSFASVVMT